MHNFAQFCTMLLVIFGGTIVKEEIVFSKNLARTLVQSTKGKMTLSKIKTMRQCKLHLGLH